MDKNNGSSLAINRYTRAVEKIVQFTHENPQKAQELSTSHVHTRQPCMNSVPAMNGVGVVNQGRLSEGEDTVGYLTQLAT